MLIIILFIFLGLIIAILSKSLIIVQESEVIIIEKLGKFNRILNSGLHFLIPFIENPRYVNWSVVVISEKDDKYHRYIKNIYRIDLRESVYDFPKQNVITKDNVAIEINGLLYYQIFDAHSAVYQVINLSEAIEKLTQTSLRNILGSIDLDEILISRDNINEKLTKILDEASHKWGVKINRVELQEINPPHDIRIAMEKQMRAERDKRATILSAEGTKRATILEAEGQKESAILKAEGNASSKIITTDGEAKSKLKIAEAEAQALILIQNSLPNSNSGSYLIALKYIESFSEMAKSTNNKVILMPYESNSLINSISVIKEIFQDKKTEDN